MTLRSFGAGLAIPILLPLAAFAEPGIKELAAADAFYGICAAKGFTFDLAKDTAGSEGWTVLPAAGIAENAPDIADREGAGWAFVPGDIYPAMLFLYVYRGVDPDMGEVEVCTLFFREQNARDTVEALQLEHDATIEATDAYMGSVTTVLSLPGDTAEAVIAAYRDLDPISLYLTAIHKK